MRVENVDVAAAVGGDCRLPLIADAEADALLRSETLGLRGGTRLRRAGHLGGSEGMGGKSKNKEQKKCKLPHINPLSPTKAG